MRKLSLILLTSLCHAACGGAGPDPTTPDGDPLAGTTELAIPVPQSGRTYVSLAEPAVITPSGDPKTSPSWDLAFEGYSIYTNSGVSGSGQGGAFGPLDLSTLSSSSAPDIPFISADKAGGAFLEWYAYDGGAHVLYSRFHTYGVKDGARLWKVQILTYYGLQNSAPTSALYQIRYADISSGAGAAQQLNVDGTTGGITDAATAPAGCLDLGTGTVSMLTVSAAQASSAWHLCFRRDAISVNGEVGGPRGIGAVDLQAAQTANEQLTAVKQKTADSEKSLFDGVSGSTLAGATFRGDHIVSAFETGVWVTPSQPLPQLVSNQGWLVVDASGHKFLVSFSAFQNATTSSPGTVVAHIKPVSG
jgi:hypothetical protein